MTLGAHIAALRKEQNMTQEALASLLDVTNQAVSKWETDQCYPDVSLLPRLADIFRISLDRLFGREEPAPKVIDLPWEDDGELRAVVYIGRTLRKHQLFERGKTGKIQFEYKGPALNVTSDFSVICGDVAKNVSAKDGVNCGNVGGSINAGDGVNCGNVDGNVTAGDGVNCGNVGGSVRAGDSIRCGDIAGNATAGDSIRCTGLNNR